MPLEIPDHLEPSVRRITKRLDEIRTPNLGPEGLEQYRSIHNLTNEDSHLGRLAANDDGAFQNLTHSAFKDLSQRTLPSIRANLAAQGLSSGTTGDDLYASALGTTASNLANKRIDISNQAYKNVLAGKNVLFNNPFYNTHITRHPKKRSFFRKLLGLGGSVLGSFLPDIVGFAGGRIGRGVGRSVGSRVGTVLGRQLGGDVPNLFGSGEAPGGELTQVSRNANNQIANDPVANGQIQQHNNQAVPLPSGAAQDLNAPGDSVPSGYGLSSSGHFHQNRLERRRRRRQQEAIEYNRRRAERVARRQGQ